MVSLNPWLCLKKHSLCVSQVNAIREKNGRFLKKVEKSGLWFEIGDDQAREKTSQALRQRAPEMRKLLLDHEMQGAHAQQQQMMMGMPQGMPPMMMPGMNMPMMMPNGGMPFNPAMMGMPNMPFNPAMMGMPMMPGMQPPQQQPQPGADGSNPAANNNGNEGGEGGDANNGEGGDGNNANTNNNNNPNPMNNPMMMMMNPMGMPMPPMGQMPPNMMPPAAASSTTPESPQVTQTM